MNTKPYKTILTLILALTLTVTLISGYASKKDAIWVSIAPQKYIIEKIVGGLIPVKTIINSNQTPAYYDPSARQLASFSGARMFFTIGMPFETTWLPKLKALSPTTLYINHASNIELIESTHTHDQHEDAHDPHLWTDPLNVIVIAEASAEALSREFPEHGEAFNQNLEIFRKELETLHRDIVKKLANRKRSIFMTFHPSWAYFARRYNLKQVAIEHEGKSPGTQQLARLIEYAKENELNTVFTQPQFPSTAVDTIAKAIGADIIILNPLAEQYLDNMEHVSNMIAESMK